MKHRRLSVTFLLISLLPAYPQSTTPQGALEELVTTERIEVVLRHLPLKIVEAFNTLDAKQKAEAESTLVVSKRFEAEGAKLRKGDDGKSWEVVKVQKPGKNGLDGEFVKKDDPPKPIVITLKNSLVSGSDAILLLEIKQEDHTQPVMIGMKLEDGEWRVASIGEMHSLDSEEFLGSMIHSRSQHAGSAAVATLRTLNTALVTYCSTYPESGLPSSLAQLSVGRDKEAQPTPEHAQLLDESFAETRVIRDGYEFQYTLVRQGKACSGEYRITATPVELGKSGNVSYFTDQDAVIRATKEPRPANENDPPL